MDWEAIFKFALLILAVVIYLLATGSVAWAAYETVKDFTEERNRAVRVATRFEDNLQGRDLTRPTPFDLKTMNRRDELKRTAIHSDRKARVALIVLYTPFLWPVWGAVFAVAGLVGAVMAANKAVKKSD